MQSELTVGTWNVGKGTLKNAQKILDECDVLGFQEASDQDALFSGLRKSHFVVRFDQLPGQAALGLAYDPSKLTAVTRWAVVCSPGQDVGLGTGPDHMKTKWLIGANFLHTESRRRVSVSTTHLVAGQGHHEREDVARRHVAHVRARFEHYTGNPIVLADWNALPRDPILDQLRFHGWQTDQVVGGRLPTHGTWSPDHVWWRESDRVSFKDHHTIATKSDHDALVVTLKLKHRDRVA